MYYLYKVAFLTFFVVFQLVFHNNDPVISARLSLLAHARSHVGAPLNNYSLVGNAQMCSELKNITRSRDSIIVNTRQSRLCIQCLDNGVPLAGAVTWTGQGGPQNNFLLTQTDVQAGLEYVNGILVFVQPMLFIQDGIQDELRVTCGDNTIRYDDSEIISDCKTCMLEISIIKLM